MRVVYETITSRLPDDRETEICRQLVEDMQTMYAGSAELANQMCADTPLHEGVTAAELAAWTMLASSIYNLDITKTRD